MNSASSLVTASMKAGSIGTNITTMSSDFTPYSAW